MGWDVNRTVNGATNGMGRLQDDGWEDERDGISTRTMHGAMNGMGRKLGGYIWMGKDECHGTTDEKK